MIKKYYYLLVAVLFFAACAGEDTQKDAKEAETKSETPAVEVLTLAEFGDKAADFLDKEVKVSGTVDHVCKHGGKKLFLVEDGVEGGVKVFAEEKFDEALIGTKVTVVGIVKEFRVDEDYCHSLEVPEEGEEHGEDTEEIMNRKKEQAQYFRDSMKNAGVDHLSFYSLEFVSFEE